MTDRKSSPTPKKKASGRNVKESERSRKQVTLRLTAEELRVLDAVAERRGLTRSAAVASLAQCCAPGTPSGCDPDGATPVCGMTAGNE